MVFDSIRRLLAFGFSYNHTIRTIQNRVALKRKNRAGRIGMLYNQHPFILLENYSSNETPRWFYAKILTKDGNILIVDYDIKIITWIT